jgi:hypothetical protein
VLFSNCHGISLRQPLYKCVEGSGSLRLEVERWDKKPGDAPALPGRARPVSLYRSTIPQMGSALGLRPVTYAHEIVGLCPKNFFHPLRENRRLSSQLLPRHLVTQTAV